MLVAEDNRGALEGLIQVSGSGMDKEGEKVDFSALITKSGDKAAIAEKAFFTELSEHISDGNPARSFEVPDTMRLAW